MTWHGGRDKLEFPDEGEEGVVKELREVIREKLDHIVNVGRCPVVPT